MNSTTGEDLQTRARHPRPGVRSTLATSVSASGLVSTCALSTCSGSEQRPGMSKVDNAWYRPILRHPVVKTVWVAVVCALVLTPSWVAQGATLAGAERYWTTEDAVEALTIPMEGVFVVDVRWNYD